MSTFLLAPILALSGLLALAVHRRIRIATAPMERLTMLWEQSAVQDGATNDDIDWARSAEALQTLGDRLGKAGFFTRSERGRAFFGVVVLAVVPFFAGLLLGLSSGTPAALFGGISAGVYVGAGLSLGWLRLRTRDFEREVLFQIPLVLEALILLVEAGLSILPALERIVSQEEQGPANPVKRLFRLVYELSSHGVPLGMAFEMVADAADLKVLRHVLLHLDITGNEGGELIPALRSLSEHAHTEWRLSVEYRVKRLENLVVFPVFASVIGLMLLTAAVPLVPVLKIRESLSSSQSAGHGLPSTGERPMQEILQ